MSTTTPEELEFNLSPDRIGELAALADTAAADVEGGWYLISFVLRDKREAADVDTIAIAFDYHLQERGERNSNSLFHAAHLKPLVELPPAVADLWEKVVAAAKSPWVRARLHDLLYVLGRQPKHKHAEQAALAYLELGGGSWDSLYRASALVRGLDIARAMNRDGLANDVMTQMITNARENLDGAELEPGVSLLLLGRLLDEKDPSEAVDSLLAAARAKYSADPYAEADAAMLQRRRAKGDKDALEQVDQEIVAIWTKAAETSAGMRKIGFLTKAIEYAQDCGQNEMRAKATAALQMVSIEDLAMQSIRVPVEYSEQEVSEWVGYFTFGEDWRQCISRFSVGTGGIPPSGNTEVNRAAVEIIKQQNPIYASVRHVKVGSDGLPRWEAKTDDEHEQKLLSDEEIWRMELSAPLFAKALHEIGNVHQPGREEIEGHFAERPTLPKGLPRVLADALIRYWAEDYEACAYSLVPKIEAMLRALARAVDESVYRIQRGKSPGQYAGLGALLPMLGKRGFDESWIRYLTTLLSGPTGWNLRNELAHGFVERVPGPIAALLIQAALYVAAVAPTTTEESTSDPE